MEYKYKELLRDKEAVIFDLDGTVVDSMWVWHSIDMDYLGRLGKELPPDLQQSIEGMSFTETAVYFKERFGLSEDVETIKEQWNEMAFEKYTTKVALKKGADSFLRRLRKDGYKLGIASSNSRQLIEGVLRARGVLKLFDAITTACEAGAGKPAPDIYLLAAKKLGAEPSKCLVFEDIPMGLMAGNAAGMVTCAVEDEYSHPMREKKAELSDYFIEDYDEIEFDRD